MPTIDNVAARRRALRFLAKQQQADGSFLSFSSASAQPFRRLRGWQTTFVSALMLAALTGSEEPEALTIRRRLADFLLTQKDPDGSFNYWSRTAPEYASMAYPNDLDDTFCALLALRLHDPALAAGKELAQAVKLLLATETEVGGPYRTWLVSPDSRPIWLDVDMAVNSNIAYFLSLFDNRLPSLDNLMSAAIRQNNFSSPYYPSPYAFLYYFSRAYRGPEMARLLRKVRRAHRQASNDLERAICLSARLRLGDTQDVRPAVSELVAGQRRDGSWPAAAFYADPEINGKAYFNGAAALTTAFAVEALQLYDKHQTSPSIPSTTVNAAGQQGKALALASQQCRTLQPELRMTIMRSLRKLAASPNGNEIIGLGKRFNNSFDSPLPKAGQLELQLGLANLYGWLAFTVYDDFMDQTGKPSLLPAANVAMRQSFTTFGQALPGNADCEELARRTFDTIDGANAWEVAHCRLKVRADTITLDRLPDFSDLSKLAERSLGHALPVLIILLARGTAPKSADFRHINKAMSHYLIARQLNDDCHDWADDLANGQATCVVTRLLKSLELPTGQHSLSDILQEGRRQFWHETLPEICREMRRQLAAGRHELGLVPGLRQDNVIRRLLDHIDVSIGETLDQHAEAESFLKQYQQAAR